MEKIKLGIVGFSEGNGHPFSWSAILNGYSPKEMANCGYPSIYEYLLKNQSPSQGLDGVEVVSVYTQDLAVSKKIAACSLIPEVARSMPELLDGIDALLLARDDAENHMYYAHAALHKGLPVFIDKPIALSLRELDALYETAQSPKQIFSCSALRFAKEIYLTEEDRAGLGVLREINCSTPKSWNTYGVHLIDPLVCFMGEVMVEKLVSRGTDEARRELDMIWTNGVKSTLCSTGSVPSSIEFQYVGSKGSITKVFHDSYSCFRRSLIHFVDGVRTKRFFDENRTLQEIVKIIEAGKSK